jgi:dTDP-glucose 4,6-dehydratase
MSKFIVIGSNSFSGAWMIDLLLERGHEVWGVSRSPEKSDLYLAYKAHCKSIPFKQYNIQKTIVECPLFLDFKPDYVINYAAESEVFQSSLTPMEYYATNTVAVVALCEHLRKMESLKGYIHISSAEIYGNCVSPAFPYYPLRPTTAYAASKAAADHHLLTLHKYHDFPVQIIRTTNVYGPHQQLWKIIPRTVIKFLKGEKIQLHGGGDFIRPFLHIEDACQGVLNAITYGEPGRIYHFSPRLNESVGYVVERICFKMDKSFVKDTQSVDERSGHDYRYWLDSKASKKELGWMELRDIDLGLDEFILWIKQNWNEIQNEPLEYVHKGG